MAPSDVGWYHMDRPDNQMVINLVAWSERPFDPDRLAATLEERWLPAFPRLRQYVTGDRMGIGGHARWVEAAGFSVRHHLRLRQLPPPGDLSALQAYVSHEAAVRLEHSRPLWEVHVLDGLGAGGAILLRLHHAIADGHLLVRLVCELDERQPPSLLAEVDRRSRELAGAASAASRRLAHGLEAVAHPQRLVSEAADLASLGAVAFSEPSGARALRARLSGHKELRWLPPVDLAPLKQLCRAAGLTLNDFWLGAFAGGLRAYLIKRTSPPGPIRVIVPVDLRPPREPIDLTIGNHFGLVFVSLPISEERPRKRLAAIKRAMDDAKASDEAHITYEWIRAAGRAGMALGSGMLDRFSGHCSAIVSNVAGPQSRIVLGGAEVAGIACWVPTSGSIGVGMCVHSYAGTINFGLSVDRAIIAEPDRLLDEIRSESDRLQSLLARGAD